MKKKSRWLQGLFGLLALGVMISTFSALTSGQSQDEKTFKGLGMGLSNHSRLTHAKTRSISPENFTGEKGKAGMSVDGPAKNCARDLGQGWKISPYVTIKAKQTLVMADVKGQGAIQQIWCTPAGTCRFAIIRFYWDGETEPSVECPLGDFFASGWGQYAQVSSLPVCVNPGRAFNSYWLMPFRKSFKITLENIAEKPLATEEAANNFTIYYQINYTLTQIPEDAAYFHAQFRRVNPLPYKDVYTILDGVQGWGHYVGTYMAWGVNNNGWWGEGEIKFFLDGDSDFPTICGTGTEDYFCGSYDFDSAGPDGVVRYTEFSTPYTGLAQVIRGDGHYNVMQRFGLYRWHIMDPIRFEKDLKVTIQALGWMSGGRYLPLQDDIASVAFWYQQEPHAPFPKLPEKDKLEVI